MTPRILRSPLRRTFTPVVVALLIGLAASTAHARLGGGHSYSGGSHSSSSSHSFSSHSSSSSSSHSFSSHSSSSSPFSSHSSSSPWSSSSSSTTTSSSSSSSQPYESSSSSSSGGDGDVTLFLWVLVLLAIFVAVAIFMIRADKPGYTSAPEQPRAPPRISIAQSVRRMDPTFSETVFIEWATLLFMRYHKARGDNDLAAISPFLAPDVENAPPREGQALKSVEGVVVGGVGLSAFRGRPDRLELSVRFEANYTTTFASGEQQSWWTHETWTFARAAGVKSRLPDDVERFGCPSCGSPLERTSLARCASCGNALTPGVHDWYVARVDVQSREKRGPLLTGDVEEVGTDLPTVYDPNFTFGKKRLLAKPGFSWPKLEERARFIFGELQAGWTQQKWERLRPWETEAVFQQHRFWLEEFRRSGITNVLDHITLSRVVVCKVDDDPHYDVVTARMFASMIDVRVNAAGAIVGGNTRVPREFTEYWTFVRRQDAATTATSTSTTACPSCGAPLQISQAGVCGSCGSKVTSGKFDWVLSRIEQDEEYVG